MSFPQPGLHLGIPEAEYHSLGHQQGVISKSLLWKFASNPHKWRYGSQTVSQTPSMAWGSLVDCLLLTPSAFDRDFVVSPYAEFRTNEAKLWRDNERRTVVKQQDLDEARKAVGVLEANDLANAILRGAQTQVSIVTGGTEPVTGEVFRAKARLDIVPDRSGDFGDWLFDLKTCPSLNKIPQSIADYGYHAQAAFYLSLHAMVTGENRTRWGFLFQESESPYEVAIVELDEADIAAGRVWCQDALAQWCRCERDQSWPSPWDDSIKIVSRPAWAQKGDAL